jgi:aspartokinase-like uncharacterized kinase
MLTETNSIRVVKVGGSLLDFDLFAERIEDWVRRCPSAKTVFVVGGGHRADQVRQWEQRFSLDPSESHWNCIEMMELNAILVASWFPGWVWIDDLDPLRDSNHFRDLDLSRDKDLPIPIVFAPKKWLVNLQPPLPESWVVTSDSIAARLASELKAKELVVLKSADPPIGENILSLVESGYLDQYFPVAAAGQSVRLVNLRSAAMPEVVLIVGRANF